MWNVRDVEDAQGRELGTELDSVFFLSFLWVCWFVCGETDDDRDRNHEGRCCVILIYLLMSFNYCFR